MRVFLLLLFPVHVSPGAELLLRVVDPLGDPVPGAEVRLTELADPPRLATGFLLRTGALGEVTLTRVLPGRYEASALVRRRKRKSLRTIRVFEVSEGTSVQPFELVVGLPPSRAFRVSGRLLGVPQDVQGLLCIVLRSSHDSGPAKAAMIDNAGRFTLPLVKPGSYRVSYRVSGINPSPEDPERLLKEIFVEDNLPNLVLSWYQREP